MSQNSAAISVPCVPQSEIAAPRPHRLSTDLFAVVAESIKTSPSPTLRLSSPHLQPSPTSNSALPAPTPATVDEPTGGTTKAIAIAQPSEHKPHHFDHIAEKHVSPFLGEILSVHEGLHQQVLAYETGKLTVDGMGILRMSRAQSLEGLSSILSDAPVLIKLPKARASTELGDMFEAIPKNSWMFPYILACSPPVLLQELVSLPKLIDVPNQRRSTGAVSGSGPPPSSGSYSTSSGFMSHAAHKFGFSDTRLSSLDDRSHSHHHAPPHHAKLATVNEPHTQSIKAGGTPPPMGPMPTPKVSFPSSWRSLGVLLVTQDPSWRPWEKKHLFLLDNFLVEASVDGSKLLGYGALAAATIKKCPFTDPHGRARCYSGSGSTSLNVSASASISGSHSNSQNFLHQFHHNNSSNNSSSNNNNNSNANINASAMANSSLGGGSLVRSPAGGTMAAAAAAAASSSPFAIRKEDLAYGLVISCYTRSDRSSPQHSFWITCRELQDLEILQNVLVRASHLRVDDVFDLPETTPSPAGCNVDGKDAGTTAAGSTPSILGRGRFNEVRLGRRKKYRLVDRRILEKMASPLNPTHHNLSYTNLTHYSLAQLNNSYNNGNGTATNRNRTLSTGSVSSATATASARFMVGSLTVNPSMPGSYVAASNLPMGREDSNSSLYQLQYYDDEAPVSSGNAPARRRSRSNNNNGPAMQVVQQASSMDQDATGLSIDDDYFLPDAPSSLTSRLPSQQQPGVAGVAARAPPPLPPSMEPPGGGGGGGGGGDNGDQDTLLFGDLDVSSHGGSVVGQRSGDNLADLASSMSLYDDRSSYIPRPPMVPSTGGGFVTSAASTFITPRKPRLSSVGEDEAGTHPPAAAAAAAAAGGVTEFEDRWCALKLVSKEIFWERVEAGKERGDALIREVLAQLFLESQGHWLWSLQHQHASGGVPTLNLPFVRLYSVLETLTGFALELELMDSNDLFDTVAAHGVMSEEATRHIVAQMVDAISFCQRLGMAHRDIKLSNITFPKKAEPSSASFASAAASSTAASASAVPSCPEVKLADFGMAGFLGTDRKLRGRCGTPGYVAPEILSAGVNEPYGINVDIFSLGVVAYTLLCGYEPFYGQDQADLLRANRVVEYAFHSPEWDAISVHAKDWIRRALEVSPEARLSAEEAKRLPWLHDLFVAVKKPSGLHLIPPLSGSQHTSSTTSATVKAPTTSMLSAALRTGASSVSPPPTQPSPPPSQPSPPPAQPSPPLSSMANGAATMLLSPTRVYRASRSTGEAAAPSVPNDASVATTLDEVPSLCSVM